jgi:hypothetical protein
VPDLAALHALHRVVACMGACAVPPTCCSTRTHASCVTLTCVVLVGAIIVGLVLLTVGTLVP